MKIRRDFFRVAVGGRNEDGTKAEPEEQATARVLHVDSETTHGGAPTSKNMATEVVAYATAGEVAAVQSRQCQTCKHFDRTGWNKLVNDAEHGTHEERFAINQVRGELMANGLADTEDVPEVEGMLHAMGKCHALSAAQKDLIVVHPESSCPGEICTPTQPRGFYQPRDRAHAKIGQRTRDQILQAAQGKTL